MNAKPPGLRRHKTGIFFCRWGGKDHYFTRDQAESQKLYLQSLAQWTDWRQHRNTLRFPPLRSMITVQELHDRFLQNRGAERGAECEYYYRKSLRLFVASYADIPADAVRPAQLQRLKDVLASQGRAPKTVNHTVQAVKTMFGWGADMELIRSVNLRGVKLMSLPPIPNKSWTPGFVRRFILECPDEKLRPWLAVNYLCALRPIETVRIVNGEYEWEQRGVMIIKNKAWRRVRLARRVLFSAEAFSWWRRCEPIWSRLDSYSARCRSVAGSSPHRLRHSAATHLLQAGVPREDCDAFLGHYPSAVSLIYMPLQWRRLRLLGCRLSLQ